MATKWILKQIEQFMRDWLTFYCFYSLPWDQTTPLGYFGEIWFTIINEQVFWIASSQVLLLFIFLCANNFAFSEMFAGFVDEFDQAKKKQMKYEAIRKIVDFNNDVKR